MKIWSNAIVVVICVFLALGGCQSTKNAEASRPVDQAADELKTEPISVPNSAAIATANEPAEANAAPMQLPNRIFRRVSSPKSNLKVPLTTSTTLSRKAKILPHINLQISEKAI